MTPSTAPDRAAVAALLAGGMLYLAAVVGLELLPTGPGEFAYRGGYLRPLPFAPMRGFTAEQALDHGIRLILMAPGLLLLAFGVGRAARRLRAPGEGTLGRLALGASALSVLLSTALLLGVFGGRAIVDDELTYAMQAQLLADGRLAIDNLPSITREPFTVASELGFTGKYLPGEPLVQLPGVLVGLPALMHLPLAALTLLLLHRLVAMTVDRTLAAWAVILLALSPTFIVTAATGQSTTTSLFCVVLAGYGLARLRHGGGPVRGALLLGFAVSFGMHVRPQATAPVGTVLVVAAGLSLVRGRRWLALALLAAVLTLGAGTVLAYNHVVAGSPLTLPWFLFQPIEHYGFGRVWTNVDYEHTPLSALVNLAVVAVRFNAWWLGWPASLLVMLWWWWRVGRPARGAGLWLICGAAVVVFEGLYHSTGISDTGPMYHFELLVPLVWLGAHAVRRGMQVHPRWAVAVLLVHFCFGTTSFLGFHVRRLDRLVTALHHTPDRVLAALPTPALLLYESHCSERRTQGWIWSAFPKRIRRKAAPVVTYPRPEPRHLNAYLAAFPERRCFYFRRVPPHMAPQLLPCSEARPLLARPLELDRPCALLVSTAQAWGWREVIDEH